MMSITYFSKLITLIVIICNIPLVILCILRKVLQRIQILSILILIYSRKIIASLIDAFCLSKIILEYF